MTSIFINRKSNYTGSGKVTEEPYSHCSLFIRYKHYSERTIKPGKIWIYKEYNSGFGGYLTLTPNGYYNNHGLFYEHVYFNKYEKKTPLILVLHFQDGGKLAKNRWYPYSKLSPLIDRSQTRRIEDFNLYNDRGDVQLLQELLNENDNISSLLTYQLEKKNTIVYNNGKIKIRVDTDSVSKIKESKFIKIKHEPESKQGNKNACIIYDKNFLMGDDLKPIESLQNQKYDYVCVYWSNEVDIPLLIEISKKGNIEYYFHKKNDEGSLYWKLLDSNSSKELLKKPVEENIEMNKLLNSSDNDNLLKLLNSLKSKLDKALVIMIDKQSEYKNSEANNVFENVDKRRIINNNISVTDETKTIGVCLKEFGFKVYVHDFSDSVTGIKEDELVHMNFFMKASSSSKYNQLKLFKDNNTNVYRSNKNSEDKVYVYFYGDDPRPLLICYNNDAYVPYSEDKYFKEWVKMTNINKCVCNSGENEQILMSLTQVVGFLNTVQLNQKPTTSSIEIEQPNYKESKEQKYSVQTFNDKKIEMKFTYWNLNCNRVYTHTPIISKGYRLGNVKYGDDTLSYSSFKSLMSVEVYFNVYDTKCDYPLLIGLGFKDEGDKDDHKEYYKLLYKETKMWEKIDINLNKLENTIFKIRRDLEITFTEEQKKTPLFNPEKCEENDNDNDNSKLIEASVGAAGAVGAAGGIGFGIFKNYSSVLSFFRSLF